MVQESCMKLCIAELDFLEKFFLPQKLGKWTKNGAKTRFFNLLKNLGINFLLNLLYDKNLCCLLCFCISPISGKMFVSVICLSKQFSANQIAGILNLLHFDTNLHKLKGHQKICWVGMAKNGCGQSDHRTLKLTVSQE